MVTFQILTGTHKGDYVIAFEDVLSGNGSDFDYNDLVLDLGPNIVPSPEPSTLVTAFAGLGALGLAGLRRRRKALAAA